MPELDPVLLSEARTLAAYLIFFCSVEEALSAPELLHDRMRKKPVFVLVVVLVGFLVGVPPALSAAIGAALLLITRTVEPSKVYAHVDWGVLVFFVGLFIIVAGAERAGLMKTLLQPVAMWDLHTIAVFVPLTALVSNLVSNVPAVMLLRTLVVDLPDPHSGWLALAMASTLAGNLTITGSVANIIVVERAGAEGVHVVFREYLRTGLPLTVATLIGDRPGCGSRIREVTFDVLPLTVDLCLSDQEPRNECFQSRAIVDARRRP